MTIREQLVRQVRPMKVMSAVGFYGFLFSWIVTIPVGVLAAGLAVSAAGLLLLVISLLGILCFVRCPACHQKVGSLFLACGIRRPIYCLGPDVRTCPSCGVELDSQSPEEAPAGSGC